MRRFKGARVAAVRWRTQRKRLGAVLALRGVCFNFARMNRFPLLLALLAMLMLSAALKGQTLYDRQGRALDESGRPVRGTTFADGADSIETTDVPTGLYVWRIDTQLGDVAPAQIDTLPQQFQLANQTDGPTGQYSFLGNLGAPRLSRLFMQRRAGFSDFIFTDPLDFFVVGPERFHFTNTLSPITNLSYHECGNKDNGEDRVTALFAVNAGKRVGLGFKIDYLYGRGYYNSQSTSFLNGTLYGSYMGDRYRLHAWFSTNHMKMAENGGIESDSYVTNPESLPSKYGAEDIPTRLDKTWNRVYTNTFHLNHRYNLGFYRTTDKDGNKVERMVVDSALVRSVVGDSLGRFAAVHDSLSQLKAEREKDYVTVFVPVTSFNHALTVDYNQRRYVGNEVPDNYYLNTFFTADSIFDQTRYLHVGNTLAVELNEGFNRWAQAGITLYARHDLFHIKLPADRHLFRSYSEHQVSLGGRLQRRQGRHVNYDLLGEATQSKGSFGEFRLDGRARLNLPFSHDTVALTLHGVVNNEQPSFYYRHYHGAHAWWDNDDLKKEWRTRLEAELAYSRTHTRLRFGFENIKNYTYFATTAGAIEGSSNYLQGVGVRQATGNIQVLSAILNQDFSLGPFHWDNELAFQTTSDKDALPLPALSAYSNAYLLFRIARVLRVQLGADVRYFTKYYAPSYSPLIGQFATQAEADRVKVGDYPVVNVYANCHLKHTRFYVMATHVNKSSNGGRYFLVPHYPINPLVLRLGLSWNFFN